MVLGILSGNGREEGQEGRRYPKHKRKVPNSDCRRGDVGMRGTRELIILEGRRGDACKEGGRCR